ncbi:MAG: hypothetical protein OXE93_08895 [bacterium]|nr:hypothetical protein [bacterium]
MFDPLGYLRRQGATRGLRGGSRAWLVVGGLAWAVRIIGRASSTKRLRPALTEEIRPGQSLVVSHLSDTPE